MGETKTRCIPDTFDSHRQYMALWAPHCLKESRAQYLTDISSTASNWNKAGRGPIRVKVKPQTKDVGGSADFVTLQLTLFHKVSSCRDNHTEEFMPNDVVLLAKDRESFIRAARGTLPKNEKPKQSLLADSALDTLRSLPPIDNKARAVAGKTSN